MKRLKLIIFTLVLTLSGAIGLITGNQFHANAQTTCTAIHLTMPGEGQTVNVPYGTSFRVVATTQTSLAYLTFFDGGTILGNGNASSDSTQWTYDIPASRLSTGMHQIRAQAYYTSTSSCSTQVGYLNVVTTATGTYEFKISVTPLSLDAPTYTDKLFTAKAGFITNGTGQDVTGSTSFQWGPTLGYIKQDGNPNDASALFNTGPGAGSGKLNVTATYQTSNGQTYNASQVVNLNIFSPTTNTSDSSNTSGTSGSTSEGTTTTTVTNSDGTTTTLTNPDNTPLPPIANPVDFLEKNNNALYTCMAKIIGVEELKKLQESQQRPPFEVFVKVMACLESSQGVVPAYIAPVEPTKVKDLRIDKKLSVKNIESAVGGDKEGIVLSGYADPDTTVIIYVFSEPLVLAAKTDSSGKWTYTLDNPLEPGDHEAYVTVEGDDAQPVRSGGFAFSIASVAKTKDNPLGLSFSVQQKVDPKYFYMLYASVASLIVLGTAMGLWFFVQRRKHNSPPLGPMGNV
jgi:hypothetical protein